MRWVSAGVRCEDLECDTEDIEDTGNGSYFGSLERTAKQEGWYVAPRGAFHLCPKHKHLRKMYEAQLCPYHKQLPYLCEDLEHV